MSDRALSIPELPRRAVSWLIWAGITVLGAFALAGIALTAMHRLARTGW